VGTHVLNGKGKEGYFTGYLPGCKKTAFQREGGKKEDEDGLDGSETVRQVLWKKGRGLGGGGLGDKKRRKKDVRGGSRKNQCLIRGVDSLLSSDKTGDVRRGGRDYDPL